MPKVGSGNSPLLDRLIYGYDGTNYPPVKTDTDGHLQADIVTVTPTVDVEVQNFPAEQPVSVAAASQIQALRYGRFAGNWQKQPLTIGYSTFWNDLSDNTSLSAGTNYLTLTAVPANEVYVVRAASMVYNGTITNVQLRMYHHPVSAKDVYLYDVKPPVSGVYYCVQCDVVMAPGDQLAVLITGATATDTARFRASGFLFYTNL